MDWLQRHYIFLLYCSVKCCTSDTNATSYISTPPITSSLNITTSNIYTSSNGQSQRNQILDYEVDGINLIFILVCLTLVLCTFCCVFCYFIGQHYTRKRVLKKQIQANAEKKRKKSEDIIRNINNEKDVNINMDNNGTSNTATSSFDQEMPTNETNEDMPPKQSNHIPQFTENKFGIGSPKQAQLTQPTQYQMQHIKSHSFVSNPKSKTASPSPNQKNGRYSRRSTKTHPQKSQSKSPLQNAQKSDKKRHGTVPSNLQVEMEMAHLYQYGNKRHPSHTDESGSGSGSGSDTDTDDEKAQLKYPSPQTNKMRSFSRRTASLDNYVKNVNNKIAYDDMAQDPALAKYAHNDSDENGYINKYKISKAEIDLEESDDTDTTSDSSTEESTDSSDSSTESSSEEGSSNEDSSSEFEESDTDSDESEDGGHCDTTTGDFMENFGKDNADSLLKKIIANKQQFSKENSPKNRKSPRKNQSKSPSKRKEIIGLESEEKVREIEDVVGVIKFRANNRAKKHHVSDDSDAFSSLSVKKVLKKDIDDIHQNNQYFED